MKKRYVESFFLKSDHHHSAMGSGHFRAFLFCDVTRCIQDMKKMSTKKVVLGSFADISLNFYEKPGEDSFLVSSFSRSIWHAILLMPVISSLHELLFLHVLSGVIVASTSFFVSIQSIHPDSKRCRGRRGLVLVSSFVIMKRRMWCERKWIFSLILSFFNFWKGGTQGAAIFKQIESRRMITMIIFIIMMIAIWIVKK